MSPGEVPAAMCSACCSGNGDAGGPWQTCDSRVSLNEESTS